MWGEVALAKARLSTSLLKTAAPEENTHQAKAQTTCVEAMPEVAYCLPMLRLRSTRKLAGKTFGPFQGLHFTRSLACVAGFTPGSTGILAGVLPRLESQRPRRQRLRRQHLQHGEGAALGIECGQRLGLPQRTWGARSLVCFSPVGPETANMRQCATLTWPYDAAAI